MTPSPNTKHQRVAMRLSRVLSSYIEEQDLGEVFAAPFDVVFSDLDVVEPGLLYVSRERVNVLTDKHVRGSPDLAIEILSPASEFFRRRHS